MDTPTTPQTYCVPVQPAPHRDLVLDIVIGVVVGVAVQAAMQWLAKKGK